MSLFQTIWEYLAIPREMVPLLAACLTALVTLITWFLSWRAKASQDLALQHRSNYLKLEFEASRIFTVALDRPDIPRYLRGEFLTEQTGADLQERAYWFVCQELNLFEIAISFYRDGQITDELFATWVSWFHELGTSKRFGGYWVDLRTHYKFEMQQILDAAQKRLAKRPQDFDRLGESERKAIVRQELRDFHADVGELFDNPAILRHHTQSMSTEK